MKILVSGATGFVGRHVWPHLVAAGHDVIAAGRRPPEGDSKCLQFIPADLLNSAEIERVVRQVRPDMLMHLAWKVEHGRFWEAPENLDWVAASLHLAREVERAGAQRVVMAGTCFEYDWPDAEPCSEATTPVACAHALRYLQDFTSHAHGGVGRPVWDLVLLG